ncbi:MAG: glutathione S-transferase family protein [Shewanella sp.]
MELFYHPLSRYSQKVLIALYEKQAHFSPRLTDLSDAQARQQFQEAYHTDRLPLLKTESGELIPESSIIIEYLDRHVSNSAQLLPPEPERNLLVRLFDRIIDNDINNLLFKFERLTQANLSPSLELKRIEKQLLQQFARLDAHLSQHHWVCHDSFTLADCALIPCLHYSFNHLNLLDFDQLVRYWHQAQLRGAWMLVQQELQRTQTRHQGVRSIP